LTIFDSVWVESALENWSGKPLTFHPDAKEGPAVVLTPRGQAPRTRPVLGHSGLQRLVYDRQARTEGRFHAFRIDLRAYFGELPPGIYDVQLVFPAAAYQLHGIPGFKRQDLRSPRRTFRVSPTALEDARAQTPPNSIAILRDPPPASGKPQPLPRATLTAKFGEVLVPVINPLQEEWDKAKETPLRLRLGYERWHPRFGWYVPHPLPEIRAGMGLWFHRVPRGKSVSVLLPDPELDGDGIYRYVLGLYDTNSGYVALRDAAYSAPFVVDRAQPPATKPRKP